MERKCPMRNGGAKITNTGRRGKKLPMIRLNNMEWKNFYYLLAVEKRIGEMCFIFSDDEKKTEHYLGYTADWDEPYWIGYCDIKDGCGFHTGEELVRAPVFDHKNLQERWNKVQIESIDGLTPEEWIQNCYQQK